MIFILPILILIVLLGLFFYQKQQKKRESQPLQEAVQSSEALKAYLNLKNKNNDFEPTLHNHEHSSTSGSRNLLKDLNSND